jgi:hypothetical protein
MTNKVYVGQGEKCLDLPKIHIWMFSICKSTQSHKIFLFIYLFCFCTWNLMHGRHRYGGTSVLRVTFLPKGGNGLGLSIEENTTLTIEVHVTQDGATATSL